MPEKVNYRDVDAVGEAMHWLRSPLNCENLGLTVVDADEGWRGKRHDHSSDGQEEVYLVVEGEAELEVEDEVLALEEGDAVRVDASETRRLEFLEDGVVVVAGAA